jgi:hypothetical protein
VRVSKRCLRGAEVEIIRLVNVDFTCCRGSAGVKGERSDIGYGRALYGGRPLLVLPYIQLAHGRDYRILDFQITPRSHRMPFLESMGAEAKGSKSGMNPRHDELLEMGQTILDVTK